MQGQCEGSCPTGTGRGAVSRKAWSGHWLGWGAQGGVDVVLEPLGPPEH